MAGKTKQENIMNKQEEIRKGVFGILDDANEGMRRFVEDGDASMLKGLDETAYDILKYIQSKGGVLKVERELPRVRQGFGVTLGEIAKQSDAQKDMLKAGFGVEKDGKTYAVEPLIEEEK